MGDSDTCFVVTNDSPKQVDLIVKAQEMTIVENQTIEYAFGPSEDSALSCLSFLSFKNVYTKDVTRAGSETQKIPLSKGMTRKILVQGKQCYISVRSFTDSYDPDSYGSGFGRKFHGNKRKKGYIVHINNYRLPEKKIKLDDLVQAIDDFLPELHTEEPISSDEFYSARAGLKSLTTEEPISSDEFYSARTELVSSQNISRSFYSTTSR
jgi:hypothetical protein